MTRERMSTPRAAHGWSVRLCPVGDIRRQGMSDGKPISKFHSIVLVKKAKWDCIVEIARTSLAGEIRGMGYLDG
jgi:hypothetical protein